MSKLPRINVNYGLVTKVLQYQGLDEADKLSRRIAKSVWRNVVSKLPQDELTKVVNNITGGLGYKSSTPLDPLQMSVAGHYIVWYEAIKNGYRVLEIGTGLGRTCYAAHHRKSIDVYVTIDVSPIILAIALYGNPIRHFQECLWRDDVKIILADAVNAADILASLNMKFNHLIHDGGPNPLKNPRLYSQSFFKSISKLMRLGATASIFVGKARRAKSMVFKNLTLSGFEVVGVESLPESSAQVLRAVYRGSTWRKGGNE